MQGPAKITFNASDEFLQAGLDQLGFTSQK